MNGEKGEARPRPVEQRDVQSDREYYEEASVPGDNDPRTALDPELARKRLGEISSAP